MFSWKDVWAFLLLFSFSFVLGYAASLVLGPNIDKESLFEEAEPLNELRVESPDDILQLNGNINEQ